MNRRRSENRRVQGFGVLCIVAALVLSLSFLPRATGAALVLGRWQRLALGGAAAAIPPFVFLVGVLLVLARRPRLSARFQAALIAAMSALAIVHAATPPGHEFAAARAGQGGGLVGAVLVWAGRTALGELGLWLLIGLGVLLAGLRLFGVSAATFVERWAAALQEGWIAAVHMAQRVRQDGFGGTWRVPARGKAAGARILRTVSQWIDARRLAGRGGRALGDLSGTVPALQGAGGEVLKLEAPPILEQREEYAVAQQGAAVEPMPPAAKRRTRRPPQQGGDASETVQQESLLPTLDKVEYQLPPLALLGEAALTKRTHRWDPADTARALEQTLESFGVEARVVHWEQGPVVTRFEVQPASGVRVQKITSLTNDIALNLAAASVRIEAPIPGKSAVGIEIPNQRASLVHLKEILSMESVQALEGALLVALGKDIAGHPITADLTEMPHLLIAGATGSGKSVAINAIIASLLFRYTPKQVRFVMIDPKRIELTNYNDIPHLLVPVVINPRAAAGALKEMLRVMEQRFELFARVGVRNIQGYNELTDVEPLPYIVILIDELADLMMIAPADFEDVIVRLAQMTRATGIHLVVATQRPSVDVITGLIKANIPSRIAFAVSSQVDSRTIIDSPGAEKLLGRGDMLFLPIGASRAVRAQGSFVADSEIKAVVEWWRGQGRPAFDETLVEAGKQSAAGEVTEDHARLGDAARLVVRSGYGSVSLLQRKMRIGYVTAARLIDMLEERGVVGPAQGTNPREVLVGLEEVDRALKPRQQAVAEE